MSLYRDVYKNGCRIALIGVSAKAILKSEINHRNRIPIKVCPESRPSAASQDMFFWPILVIFQLNSSLLNTPLNGESVRD